jgi:hypothetical protein
MCAQTKVFKEGLPVARNPNEVIRENRAIREQNTERGKLLEQLHGENRALRERNEELGKLLDQLREDRQTAVLERDGLSEEVRRLADKLAGVEVERETLRRELIDQAALYRQIQYAYRVDELRLRVMRAALEGNSLREAFTSEAVLGRAPLGDIMKKE